MTILPIAEMPPKEHPTNKVAAFFRWTFGIVVGIVALVSLVLVAQKIRKNHCGSQYNRLRNEGRLAMGEFNASSQSLVMNIPNSKDNLDDPNRELMNCFITSRL